MKRFLIALLIILVPFSLLKAMELATEPTPTTVLEYFQTCGLPKEMMAGAEQAQHWIDLKKKLLASSGNEDTPLPELAQKRNELYTAFVSGVQSYPEAQKSMAMSTLPTAYDFYSQQQELSWKEWESYVLTMVKSLNPDAKGQIKLLEKKHSLYRENNSIIPNLLPAIFFGEGFNGIIGEGTALALILEGLWPLGTTTCLKSWVDEQHLDPILFYAHDYQHFVRQFRSWVSSIERSMHHPQIPHSALDTLRKILLETRVGKQHINFLYDLIHEKNEWTRPLKTLKTHEDLTVFLPKVYACAIYPESVWSEDQLAKHFCDIQRWYREIPCLHLKYYLDDTGHYGVHQICFFDDEKTRYSGKNSIQGTKTPCGEMTPEWSEFMNLLNASPEICRLVIYLYRGERANLHVANLLSVLKQLKGKEDQSDCWRYQIQLQKGGFSSGNWMESEKMMHHLVYCGDGRMYHTGYDQEYGATATAFMTTGPKRH